MHRKLLICFVLFLIVRTANAQTTELWGMTPEGGSTDFGTIFKINTDGSGFTTVHNFSLSGFTGSIPLGNLIQAGNGKLYGTCLEGGSFGSCTIFCHDPVTNTHSDVYDFDGIHGSQPMSGLAESSNGLLYGATLSGGGANSMGVIYSFDPATNVYSVLFEFVPATGSGAFCSPIVSNNTLYGTTVTGGLYNFGVFYSFDLINNTYTDLFDFDSINGIYPMASLIKLNNGKLYGTASQGGIYGAGVIFSFDPASNIFQKLHDFNPTTGSRPLYGALIEGNNGNLYGTTSSGGSIGQGALFGFNITNNFYQVLYNLDGINGSSPMANLFQASNGKFYGTTNSGGANNKGVIFEYDLTTNIYTDLLDFNGPNGSAPQCGLIELSSTGIAQLNAAANKFFVYPNPAYDKLNIHIPADASQNADIIIRNIIGQEVLSFQSKEVVFKNNVIDINPLNSGIYFVEIMMNGKTSVVKFTKE